LANTSGLLGWLETKGILLKDFPKYAEAHTQQLRAALEKKQRSDKRLETPGFVT
jgi:hypothetical protein